MFMLSVRWFYVAQIVNTNDVRQKIIRCGYTHHGHSRGKFATVNFYSCKLYQGDLQYTEIYLPRLISVFTQLFSGKCLGTFRASGIFGFKKLLISRIKERNITQMVQVEFLKFQNQVNRRVNPNSNLPCKNTTFAQIIWCVSKRFQMILWRQFWNQSEILPSKKDHNVSFFWFCWKEKR